MQPVPSILAAGFACAAGGTFSWAAVAPSAQLFGPTICRTGDASTVALTFDDGPNPAITPKLLDLLDRHNVRATFFVIGRSVRAYPALAKQIADRCHVIANHTDTHPALTLRSSRNIDNELELCDLAIEAAVGCRTRWMRPPFGFRGPQLNGVIQRRHCEGVVMWSAKAWDWTAYNPERVINRLRHVRGGDIVLLHDGDHRVLEGDRRHTLAALEYWLPRWNDAGMRFANLDDLYPRAQVATTNG
jgi:peptidoglycan/xylan/chitin deacetylase (PgdA/CDA1 family)